MDPMAICVVDAKSVFDASNTEQATGEDDRSALEIAVVQDSLAKLQGRLRWIPHNDNPADMLTKLSGAHEEPLLKLLQNHTLRIQAEATVLEGGKQSVYRKKQKGLTAEENTGADELV